MSKSAKTGGRKKSDILQPLNMRKRKYVEGRLAGKSKKDSALAAGFSESMAKNAAAKIESADVRQAFQELAREAVPAEKIVQRLREGLDAMETKFFQYNGEVQETREVIAWGERRAYLELAAKFGGQYVENLEVQGELNVSTPRERIAELLARAAARRSALSQ